MQSLLPPRRRDLLFMIPAMAGFRSVAASPPFWNTKPPAEWSESEIDALVTDSPWARRFTISVARTLDDYAPPIPQAPTASGGGWGIPGAIDFPRRRASTPSPRTTPMQVEGIVRWESALPIVDALRVRLPEELKDALVISISGIPLSYDSPARSVSDLESIRQSARLERNGDVCSPYAAQNGPLATGMTRSILLGFARDKVSLSPASRSIEFTARIAGGQIKTKFKPAEMVYRGNFTA